MWEEEGEEIQGETGGYQGTQRILWGCLVVGVKGMYEHRTAVLRHVLYKLGCARHLLGYQ